MVNSRQHNILHTNNIVEKLFIKNEKLEITCLFGKKKNLATVNTKQTK